MGVGGAITPSNCTAPESVLASSAEVFRRSCARTARRGTRQGEPIPAAAQAGPTAPVEASVYSCRSTRCCTMRRPPAARSKSPPARMAPADSPSACIAASKTEPSTEVDTAPCTTTCAPVSSCSAVTRSRGSGVAMLASSSEVPVAGAAQHHDERQRIVRRRFAPDRRGRDAPRRAPSSASIGSPQRLARPCGAPWRAPRGSQRRPRGRRGPRASAASQDRLARREGLRHALARSGPRSRRSRRRSPPSASSRASRCVTFFVQEAVLVANLDARDAALAGAGGQLERDHRRVAVGARERRDEEAHPARRRRSDGRARCRFCCSCWSTATSCARTAAASRRRGSREPKTLLAPTSGRRRTRSSTAVATGCRRASISRARAGRDLRRVGEVVVAAGAAVGDAAHERRVEVGAEAEGARLDAVLEGATRARSARLLGRRCRRRSRGRPRGASRCCTRVGGRCARRAPGVARVEARARCSSRRRRARRSMRARTPRAARTDGAVGDEDMRGVRERDHREVVGRARACSTTASAALRASSMAWPDIEPLVSRTMCTRERRARGHRRRSRRARRAGSSSRRSGPTAVRSVSTATASAPSVGRCERRRVASAEVADEVLVGGGDLPARDGRVERGERRAAGPVRGGVAGVGVELGGSLRNRGFGGEGGAVPDHARGRGRGGVRQGADHPELRGSAGGGRGRRRGIALGASACAPLVERLVVGALAALVGVGDRQGRGAGALVGASRGQQAEHTRDHRGAHGGALS